MVLVDTSVWIEHFRQSEPRLQELLCDGLVLMHPFVLGELACGTIKDRVTVLAYLNALPKVADASHDDTLSLIEGRKLWRRGIGWVDVTLMASALLTNCRFWTMDNRLKRACHESGLPTYPESYSLPSVRSRR